MPALLTATDLQAWLAARAPATADGWLDAATALRQAALGVSGVAALSGSAAFQTRGRGPAVGGVALAPQIGGGVRADVAVVLAAEAAAERGRLAAVSRAVGQAVRAAWRRLGDPAPLDLQVHVVDVGTGAGL